MFPRVRRALLWVQVLSKARAGDFTSSLALMDRMEVLGAFRPFEQTFRATLLLRNKEHGEADREFERIALILEGNDDPDQIYTRLYCENTLAALDGDLDAVRRTRQEARTVKCSRIISDCLPL